MTVGPAKVKASKPILFTEGIHISCYFYCIICKLKICLVFRREDKKIISRACQIGKDCDQNGDRMSKNDEKLQYLHLVTKKYFYLAMKSMGLCLYINFFLHYYAL